MKHVIGHFYQQCARCRFEWNISAERARKIGPYICPTCRKIYRAKEGRNIDKD